jgi:uncharacterized membrane protein YidH (DUF202 family)
METQILNLNDIKIPMISIKKDEIVLIENKYRKTNIKWILISLILFGILLVTFGITQWNNKESDILKVKKTVQRF